MKPTYVIQLISLKQNTVFAEMLDVRERLDHEQVHHHDPDSTTCLVCGKRGFMVWIESKDRFMQHANRCGNLPPVEIELS